MDCCQGTKIGKSFKKVIGQCMNQGCPKKKDEYKRQMTEKERDRNFLALLPPDAQRKPVGVIPKFNS